VYLHAELRCAICCCNHITLILERLAIRNEDYCTITARTIIPTGQVSSLRERCGERCAALAHDVGIRCIHEQLERSMISRER
jgi:hypothetical protein